MYRDFTLRDGSGARYRWTDRCSPSAPGHAGEFLDSDSLSPVAPFRIVNIGNSEKIRLIDFIDAIEEEIGRKAIRNYMPMQQGDVPATWADASLLQSLTGHRPKTQYRSGVAKFVAWYRDFYNV